MSVILWSDRLELVKDSADEVVKHFSYERWLVDDAMLAGSDWDVTCEDEDDPDLEVDNDTITNAGKYATFRIIGGTPGKTYVLTNTITTDETPSQTLERSFRVVVREL